MSAIEPISQIPLSSPASLDKSSGAAKGADFAGYLADTLEQARTSEVKAEDMAERFAAGDPDVGIHEVMIATERASVAMRYAVTLKNKAIEAYRDLMSTPL